jgi:uncharacterized protein (DUF924 family)
MEGRMDDPEAVLDFWLGEVGPEGWYAGGEALGARVREGFADLWRAARDGGLDHWVEGTAGALGFIILTDQLPRNMWRGAADAFATDALALGAARRAVAAGWDMGAPEPDRQFFYLPFMHAEDGPTQAECIELIAARMPETGADNLRHARAHAEVIARFGRFPARNAALGRATTPAEAAYLSGGGYAEILRELGG